MRHSSLIALQILEKKIEKFIRTTGRRPLSEMGGFEMPWSSTWTGPLGTGAALLDDLAGCDEGEYWVLLATRAFWESPSRQLLAEKTFHSLVRQELRIPMTSSFTDHA
jgi:hypothetical protein